MSKTNFTRTAHFTNPLADLFRKKISRKQRDIFLEASPRLELGVRILQTLALPLGYDAVSYIGDADTLCGAGDGVAACAATLRCEPASRVCDFIALHFVKRIPSIDFSTHKIFLFIPSCFVWSGRRDSDPRLSPWQGDTLPLSHSRTRLL